MTSSKILFYFCLSFIGGIFLSSFLEISQILFLGFLILGIFFISVFWKYQKFVIIGFCILFFVLGIWRDQQFELRIRNNELRNFNDLEKPITLIGIVSAEPDVRETNTKLTIKVEDWGKVLVITRKYPEYRYGDKLKITGKLKSPTELGDFDYPGYLAKDGIYSVINFPKIELIERNKGNFLYAGILNFKNRLRENVYQNLSPPQSSILGAIIFGDKRQISEDLKMKLNITGTRHITAISGLHITVLTAILMNFLIWLGLWRQQAFYFAIIFIALFIVMTGLQSSAIRAGIMGGLFLLAQYFGRMGDSSRAIFLAGALMLAKNPLLLKFDIGFQLSFLAMMGIIYLSSIFRDWLKFISFDGPRSILAMTFSAYLFTLPILIYNFGYISLIAPIVNLLIVPLLYWIMLFGFIFALSGIIWQPLGWISSLPCWLLLTYLTKVVDWFSSFSWSSLTLEISWIWLILSYLVLGLIVWRLNERQKLKFLNY